MRRVTCDPPIQGVHFAEARLDNTSYGKGTKQGASDDFTVSSRHCFLYASDSGPTFRMSSSSGTRGPRRLSTWPTRYHQQPAHRRRPQAIHGQQANNRSVPYRRGGDRSANTWMTCRQHAAADQDQARKSGWRRARRGRQQGDGRFRQHVCASEMGSDFQNSTLRSRRSSCRALRQ